MEFKMPEMPAGTKQFMWGAAAGALALAWVGFDAFGWKTPGAVEQLGKRQADTAVVAALAPICGAQFKAGKDLPGRMAALEKADRWSRGEFIAKGGWATMAGSTEPASGVGQACAELLIPEKA